MNSMDQIPSIVINHSGPIMPMIWVHGYRGERNPGS